MNFLSGSASTTMEREICAHTYLQSLPSLARFDPATAWHAGSGPRASLRLLPPSGALGVGKTACDSIRAKAAVAHYFPLEAGYTAGD